jgi:integrase/recombinase XerD
MGGSKERRLPQVMSREEVEALLRVPNMRAPTGIRNRAMLELMYRCGLRVGELCGLHLRDVDWAAGQLHLRASITKGGREAYAYLEAQSEAVLQTWVAVRREYAARKPHLFTTLQGGPVTTDYLRKMFKRYARRAGIERRVHPHMLRHTYATELLREGFNLIEVQHLLRHSDVRTTSVYLHIFDTDLHRKIRSRR